MHVLEIDDSKEEVQCPRCRHTWWAEVQLSSLHQGIRCPKCSTPLKAPSVGVYSVATITYPKAKNKSYGAGA